MMSLMWHFGWQNADKWLAENLCVGLSKYLNSGYILFGDIKKYLSKTCSIERRT